MNTDSGDRHSNPLWGAREVPPEDDLGSTDPQHLDLDQVLVPSGRGLISGLLGLNLVLLGAALVTGQLFNPGRLQNQEARIFLLLLMGAGVAWMLWYLLWARKQPDISPHQDHHAGGAAATSKRVGMQHLVFVFRSDVVLFMAQWSWYSSPPSASSCASA